MAEILNPVAIEKNAAGDPALDFALLRQQGIDLLQKLSGKTWTDYNLHDPGITILEQLCFAITDLAYRTDFPIEDVLTDKHGIIDRKDNSFFARGRILTTNPVTVNDFRKVILDDVEELTNVLLEPVVSNCSPDYVKGVYRVRIQVNKQTALKMEKTPGLEEEIKNKVRRCFLNRRNLCEDMLAKMVMLKPQKIRVHAQVIISESAHPEKVLAQIYHTIAQLLDPPVKRYSKKELLDKGYSVEHIYSGPMLKKGFVPDSELKPLKKEVNPLILIDAIAKVEGVVYVKKLHINQEDGDFANKPFKLKPDHFALLETNEGSIRLFTNAYEIDLNENSFRRHYQKLGELTVSQLKATVITPEKNIQRGQFRDIEHYTSIQDYFPITYGIGENGLSEHDTEERKALAKQLKAYLMLFEQVLANYLAQLANVNSFLSSDVETGRGAINTYFYQPLYTVPGVRDILRPFTEKISIDKRKAWQDFTDDDENLYVQSLRASQESPATFRNRKNRVLDHLLARFNQQLSTYPVLLYNTIYEGAEAFESRADDVLNWKADILRNMTSFSRNRVKAFNYERESRNLVGFEKKMAMLLFLRHRERRVLTDAFETDRVTLAETEKKVPVQYSQSPEEVDWNEDEQHISTESEEVKDVIIERASRHENFIFRGETSAVLKNGINSDNYRIGRVKHSDGLYHLIYRQAPAQRWKVVSLHADKKAAEQALNKLIGFLKDLSMQSEGFHMVEHLLLRPMLDSPSYGYRFKTDATTTLFENMEWTDFETREKHIRRTVRTAKHTGQPHDLRIPEKRLAATQLKYNKPGLAREQVSLKELCSIDDPACKTILADLEKNLRDFRHTRTQLYPGFEMRVKLPKGRVIAESFFSSQVTVVFPTWPARFQVADFRNFAEDLFVLNAPVHTSFNFVWLGIAEMKEFEGLYFKWLGALQPGQPQKERESLASALIDFILSPGSKDHAS